MYKRQGGFIVPAYAKGKEEAAERELAGSGKDEYEELFD